MVESTRGGKGEKREKKKKETVKRDKSKKRHIVEEVLNAQGTTISRVRHQHVLAFTLLACLSPSLSKARERSEKVVS